MFNVSHDCVLLIAIDFAFYQLGRRWKGNKREGWDGFSHIIEAVFLGRTFG